MARKFIINGREIGPGCATYIIAEMSANHNGSLERAKQIIRAAKASGADAVKLQTYTPDTMTLDCRADEFLVKGTLWSGRNLYDLYKEASTPWEWHEALRDLAAELGIDLFSTPFDLTSVAFLETMDVPAYKVASLEIVDHPLLKAIGQTGKPVIMSTGASSLGEISEALGVLRQAGSGEIALLRCVSAYPAPPAEMNLKTIPHLAETFGVVAGLSDHSMGNGPAIASVAIGGCIIEKHFTLSREDGGVDSGFSMEPAEFKAMVEAIREVEQALGAVNYDVTEKQKENVVFRRSLFASEDIPAGELFTKLNIRVVRPGHGLHPRHYEDIVAGRRAKTAIKRGTPLDWSLID